MHITLTPCGTGLRSARCTIGTVSLVPSLTPWTCMTRLRTPSYKTCEVITTAMVRPSCWALPRDVHFSPCHTNVVQRCGDDGLAEEYHLSRRNNQTALKVVG